MKQKQRIERYRCWKLEFFFYQLLRGARTIINKSTALPKSCSHSCILADKSIIAQLRQIADRESVLYEWNREKDNGKAKERMIFV